MASGFETLSVKIGSNHSWQHVMWALHRPGHTGKTWMTVPKQYSSAVKHKLAGKSAVPKAKSSRNSGLSIAIWDYQRIKLVWIIRTKLRTWFWTIWNVDVAQLPMVEGSNHPTTVCLAWPYRFCCLCARIVLGYHVFYWSVIGCYWLLYYQWYALHIDGTSFSWQFHQLWLLWSTQTSRNRWISYG